MMCALAVLKQAPSDAYYCKHSHLKGMLAFALVLPLQHNNNL